MTRNLFPQAETIRLPRPAAPAPTPTGFMLISFGSLPGQSAEQWSWQQWLYQQAFEKAQAVVSPSLLERDLLGYWN